MAKNTATAKTDAQQTTAGQSAAQKRERPNVVVLAVSAGGALPANVTKRGVRGKYKFNDLAAPAPIADKPGEFTYSHFGLQGMDKKGFSSTLFSENRKNRKTVEKRDAAGNVIYKTVEIKDQAGNVIGSQPSQEAETEFVQVKEYVAFDVDPNTDPEGATLRVYRIK